MAVRDQEYEMDKQDSTSTLFFAECRLRQTKGNEESWQVKDFAEIQSLQIVLSVDLHLKLLPVDHDSDK